MLWTVWVFGRLTNDISTCNLYIWWSNISMELWRKFLECWLQYCSIINNSESLGGSSCRWVGEWVSHLEEVVAVRWWVSESCHLASSERSQYPAVWTKIMPWVNNWRKPLTRLRTGICKLVPVPLVASLDLIVPLYEESMQKGEVSRSSLKDATFESWLDFSSANKSGYYWYEIIWYYDDQKEGIKRPGKRWLGVVPWPQSSYGGLWQSFPQTMRCSSTQCATSTSRAACWNTFGGSSTRPFLNLILCSAISKDYKAMRKIR